MKTTDLKQTANGHAHDHGREGAGTQADAKPAKAGTPNGKADDRQVVPTQDRKGASINAQNGRAYWQSLDQLAETPEFREWAEREFPAGASEWADPSTRRHFVKIMSASFLLGGFGLMSGGCRRPEQQILPFSKMPENYIHGVPQFYATAMPGPGCATALVAKSNDGRPTKLEGNAMHPDSNGSTDRYVQASILNLYDPDRTKNFRFKGDVRSADAAYDALTALSKSMQANGGAGVAFLMEREASPSRRRLQQIIAEKLPKAAWYLDDAVDQTNAIAAAKQAFNQSVKPYYRFDQADIVVSLDCDFLGADGDVRRNIQGFSDRRNIEKPEDKLNRLYVVESLMTVTGFNADHRLRIPASAVAAFAKALWDEVQAAGSGKAPEGVDSKWIAECAKDLLAHKGRVLVVAGQRQPVGMHVIAQALNVALGSVGTTVVYHAIPEQKEKGLVELASALNGGQVETLVILGGNPAYTAPADLNWATAQAKAKKIVRLGYYEDETSEAGKTTSEYWHLPAAHYLESWGDVMTSDGTMVPVQPLIAPLFGGISQLEVLARLAGLPSSDPYAVVRETFGGFVSAPDMDNAWNKYLHDGFLADSAAKPVSVTIVDHAVSGLPAANTPKLAGGNLEVILHRDYKVDDGRYNNNGWLQELPDPVTKLTWDNVVSISRKTAEELKVQNYDVVEVKLGNHTVEGPIWVQPGQADYSLGLALGYGREKTGRVGKGTGFNAYKLRTAAAPCIATGATIRKVGKTYPLSCTQSHWALEGRSAVREQNAEVYEKHPEFAEQMDMEEVPSLPLYPNPFDELKKKGVHQWGMSIDLNRCVGCSACMVACQSENNVPIVGKDQINRGRDMHWLRIDRYYAGHTKSEATRDFYEQFRDDSQQQFEKWIDDPQVVTQPMLCQHCESAPCENVCPVNATTHDQEGLNVMAYNRCVGTRYCSNNCPYKVRRFNYFDFNKRPIGKFYWGPFGKRPDDEWDLIKMIKNPDVTVRMRGVMEKCTYCTQRIEQAKIAQKVKARDSGDIVVPTDSFTTACAQACPAGAIVFGNLNDPESKVSKKKKLDRNYHVLPELLTKPRTTYLAKVRNPNTAMPDYARVKDGPLTFQEFESRMGQSPFDTEPTAGHGAEAHGGHAVEGAKGAH